MTRRLLAMLATGFALATLVAADAPQPSHPTLTDSEKQAGFKLLFDGTTTAGWRGLGMEGFPKDRWVIENGCLHCVGDEHSKAKPNDLVTTDTFENFELSFEWLVPKAKGNSGVKYRVQEKKGEGFAFGPEYQCMNDPGVENKDASGALYDVLPPKGKTLAPDGQFNRSRILVRGNHAEHWLNGVKVVEFEWGSDALKAAVAQSKFKNTPEWGRDPRGHIALQDHHDEIWFRNVKVRDLGAK
jgi:hypothetical protein